MNRTIITLFLAFLSICFMYGNANAISGACSSCHTMHDSQDGSGDEGSAGAQERLLLYTCVACHTGATTQKNGDAPVVLHTTDPVTQGAAKTNAGGDFYWVATGYGADDTKGHNVVGIAGADVTVAGDDPPGWNQAVTTGQTFDSKTLEVTGGTAWGSAANNRLTCAGTFGCHGTRDQTDFGGIQGAHHNNTVGGGSDNAGSDGSGTRATAPTTVGGSFRFLAGIKGLEDENWNWNETAIVHNEYYGVNYDTAARNASGNWGSRDTISYLCAECHGDFHGTIDSDATVASPWVRHPTDIILSDVLGDETESYNPDNANVYSLTVPIARPAVPTVSDDLIDPDDDVNVDGAIVMCLSCHRAHGSPVADLLRFTYDMQAGVGAGDTGCFVCHTAKNAD